MVIERDLLIFDGNRRIKIRKPNSPLNISKQKIVKKYKKKLPPFSLIMDFRKSNKNQKLSLHVKCSWKRVCICQKDANFEIIIQLTVDFYRCNNCINLKYGPPLELHNVLKNHYTQTMYLLSRIKFKKNT